MKLYNLILSSKLAKFGLVQKVLNSLLQIDEMSSMMMRLQKCVSIL